MEFDDEFTPSIKIQACGVVTSRASGKRRLSMLGADEDGVALILTAVLLPVLLIAAALSIDIGFAQSERSSMQQAADNAARSAAIIYYLSGLSSSADAQNEGRALAAANGYVHGANGVNVNVNVKPNISEGNLKSDPTAVEVVISKPRSNLFAGFVGNTMNVQARAVSSFTSPPCMIALRSDPNGTTGITFNGGSGYKVNCALYSNSTSSTKSISLNGNSSLTTPYAGMAGCTNATIANMQCNIAQLANPYASVLAQVPSSAPSGTTPLNNTNNFPNCTNPVGCTVQASKITGSPTFGTGKYFVTGSVSLSGSGNTFTANGATIWFQDGLRISGSSWTFNVTNSVFLFPPTATSGFRVTGGSTNVKSMTPPTSGSYAGFSVVDASNAPPANSVAVGFNGSSTDLSNGMGIFLSPNNDLRFGGSTDLSHGCYGFVAATITFGGSTDLNSTCLNMSANLSGYAGGKLTE